jgi:long-chain acyl-CoA synthetase
MNTAAATLTVENGQPGEASAVRFERHFSGRAERVIKCFPQRAANLDELCSLSARCFPDADAIAGGCQRLSYRALDARVTQSALGLRKLGLSRGDRLAFALGNRVEFVEMLLGCARIGVIAVPLNIRMRRREIVHVLNDSGAAAIVFESGLLDQIPNVDEAPNCRARVVCEGAAASARSYASVFSGHDAAGFAPSPYGEEDVAAIVYTSGTTGKPKGAAVTQLGLIHSAMSFELCAGLVRGDRSIVAVPASHITGMAAVIYPILRVGGCLVMMSEFRAEAFVELAVRERCSYAFLVPAMINLMMLKVDVARYDLSALRVVAFGGAPMPHGTTKAIGTALPALRLLQAYGATETTAAVTAAFAPADTTLPRVRSIGRVLPCADIKIMDDTGQEASAGASGELWIGGPSVIPFYWGGPDVGADSLVAGYWRSGDIGWIDAEGYVYIRDRKKDVINRAGFKIYSTEVEAVLMSHPHIDFAAVVGRPDPVLGEKSYAFLVGNSSADLQLIREHCAAQLSDYKIPDAFVFLEGEDLPRNAAGKVLKDELRERLLAD